MTRPPTIAFLTGTLDVLAGAERVTALIANGLAQRGWQVHILSLWSPRSQFALDPSIRLQALFDTRPSFKTHYLATVRGIRRHIRANGIDVLVSVDTMLSWFTLPACTGLTVRQIAWEHASFDQDLGRRSRQWARRLAARYFDHVVVLTDRDRKQWQAALRTAQRVETIGNPLPFDPVPEAANLRAPIVLAVGRLVPAKGFDVLLRAWQKVAAVAPDWSLRIIGEGECRASLETLRDRLGLHASVSLPGATQAMEAAYRDACIFCLSSRHEGFGMVLIEAMASGVPVVSTACETGPKEILRDGDNALMVPVDDADTLADRLLTLIRDPLLRQRLAAGGLAAADRYRQDIIVDRWITLLSGLARPI